MRSVRIGVLAVALLLSVTACSGEFVESKSEADTTALVQQHADAIAKTIGMPLRNAETGPAPCTGKLGESSSDVYSILGTYNVDVPAGENRQVTADRVRAEWAAQGYTVTDDRKIGTDQAVLTADTGDGFNLDVESTSGSGLAVFVHSPCFTRP
ncbi:hypothetical protein GCM10010112_65910 [Actinoplanes lobatus]|uniref:Lipoprotein n=1 Tax=Actinoplanes lobatus TaxID=113568 RepID=A0A7W7HJZ6_9ACTN|nr:hypothetical protein [Actinoplanes lobatus]MBB4751933.1 hypothetical protein [Actinoplanes lobatus]GGN85455.1 hypothetical protein GCM10010112_65910 [Actinoplanes lobatus]GIE44340.1 hypothetical protein Alo02nite_72380 [Actinoplanes lobatus]